LVDDEINFQLLQFFDRAFAHTTPETEAAAIDKPP
jgi:hypothetical protein